MTSNRLKTIGVVSAVTVLTLVGVWMLWFFYPLTEGELRGSDTKVVVSTRYMLMADEQTLFSFGNMRGDSLLTGITPNEIGFAKDTVNAQWIKRLKWLPYSRNAFVTDDIDTLSVVKMSAEDLRMLLKREAIHLNTMKRVLRAQRKDVNYYLKTHAVTDGGFDVVARYSKALTAYTDSISKADSLVKLAIRAKELNVKMECHYKAVDSVRHSVFVRVGKEDALRRLKQRKPYRMQITKSGIDSLGLYEGKRDSVAMPNGYGRFLGSNGDFYEGEWEHGMRSGVGFAMSPGKRLRLGEWKDDKFLGERITYYPERIYGIDISRYQHGKGKTKYPIEWKKLRITSLGTYSKKTIRGKVDYPVQFIYIKATEGVTIRNEYFKDDYLASRKHGYRTGVYHFFSLKTTGSEQAQNFLQYAIYQPGDLPPVIDIEPSDRQIKEAGGIKVVFKNIRALISAVERKWKVKPILYISQGFVNRHLSEAPDLKRNYDVWIARYGEYKPDVNLVFWQLCQDGKVAGIHGPVDLNVYNGFGPLNF